jgi:hypothetical protein
MRFLSKFGKTDDLVGLLLNLYQAIQVFFNGFDKFMLF